MTTEHGFRFHINQNDQKTGLYQKPVLKFIDVSFVENYPKTLVFTRVNTSIFTKTL